jgi:hypothetical protein
MNKKPKGLLTIKNHSQPIYDHYGGDHENTYLNNLDHLLCIMLLISRLGEVISAYLATLNLVLEMNPAIRKLRWPFAILTIFVCFLP